MRLHGRAEKPAEHHHESTVQLTALDADDHTPTGSGDVAWFVVLACAMSWGWLIPLAVAGATVRAGVGWPSHVPALVGPLLAAFVVTASREGRLAVHHLLDRMVRFRVPVRWWLFAVSPLLLLALVLTIDSVLGLTMPTASDFARFSGLPTRWGVLGIGIVLVVLALGEETGWRGFMLPHLQQRLSPLMATVLVAAAWVVWHAPMFLVIDSYRSFNPAITIGWAMGLFCGAVVLSWLYNRSGGSILLVSVWHGTYNLMSGTEASTGLLAAASTMAVIVLAVTLVVLGTRASRRGTPSVLGPAEPPRRS